MLYGHYKLFVQERAGLGTEEESEKAIRAVFEVLDMLLPVEVAARLATRLHGHALDFDATEIAAAAAAIAAAKERGVATHLVYLEVMADDSDAAGGEPVFADGRAIGVTTSGGYGHATGRSLAFAYVASGYETPGRALAVELLGERYPATVLAGPVYDPDNLRLRA